MSRPFAIAVAPNGARRTKVDHPRLPMTPDELAVEAAAAREAGAAMIHLHVRDAEGAHTLDADLYRQATARVRESVGDDLLIQVTTEAVGRYRPGEQIAVIDALQPQSVSIALREILPDDGGDEEAVAALFERMERWQTLHQIIVYEASEIARLDDLTRRGILPTGHVAVLAVLGRYSGTGAGQGEFDAFLAAGLERYPWMLCAFGERETHFMAQAARHGGHARVGFENNLHLPDGSLSPDNAAIVRATVEAAAASKRPVASAAQWRDAWWTAPAS